VCLVRHPCPDEQPKTKNAACAVRVHVYVCVCACARVDALQGSVCFWSDVESPITSGTCQFVSVSDRYLKRFIGTVLIL
jgi:hypothetical protein